MTLLLIGGMDSSGGAGLVRDVLVAGRLGLDPRVVVTAVTAQTDSAVTDLRPMPEESVKAQLRAAMGGPVGAPVAAVKIGMLASAGIVRAVAAALPRAPIVLDPVLAASSGRALLDAEGLDVLIGELLPRVTLLTPNLPELDLIAARLGLPPGATTSEKAAACLTRGCGAVLVKGGHAEDPAHAVDRLYRMDEAPATFRAPRAAVALRGTGCHLATAIAAGLCADLDLVAAIRGAKADLTRRFETAQP